MRRFFPNPLNSMQLWACTWGIQSMTNFWMIVKLKDTPGNLGRVTIGHIVYVKSCSVPEKHRPDSGLRAHTSARGEASVGQAQSQDARALCPLWPHQEDLPGPLSRVPTQGPPPASSTSRLFEHCANGLQIYHSVTATVLFPGSITNSTKVPERHLCELPKVRILS